MADLIYTDRYALVVAPQFLQRVEVALMKYAVYIRNGGINASQTINVPAAKAWAQNMIFSPSDRAAAVTAYRWPVLENVCVPLDLTGADDTLDSAATDAAIQAQVETQVNAAYPVA